MAKRPNDTILRNIALMAIMGCSTLAAQAQGLEPLELIDSQNCAMRLIQNTQIINDLSETVSITLATVFALDENGRRTSLDNENAPVIGMEFRVSFNDRMGFNTVVVQNDKRVDADEISVSVTSGRPGPVNSHRQELAAQLTPAMAGCF